MYAIYHVNTTDMTVYKWDGWCGCFKCSIEARAVPGWHGFTGLQHANRFQSESEAALFASKHYGIPNILTTPRSEIVKKYGVAILPADVQDGESLPLNYNIT